MSKIEKTLELNITHELLNLADSFWWYLQPISLKKYWRPHWRFPFINSPKSFATGLHINLEGKTGGGYDVCIKSPSYFQGGKPRLLFMQFKAGIERKYNLDDQSIFYGSQSNPKVHIEFDINSNANKDQHRLLQNLASSAGNKNAVVYVFPRIVNETQLQNHIGKLLTKTSFISIADLDAKATANGVTIDDGNAHKFRRCYNDYHRNEVNFFIFYFGRPEEPGGLLGEIFAIRMYRALISLQQVSLNKYHISKFHIIDAMIRHMFIIASTFSVSSDIVIENFKAYENISNRLSDINKFEDMPPPFVIEDNGNQFLNEIFIDIFSTLSIYFRWIDDVLNFKESAIPNPPTNYTIEVEEDIRFKLNGEYSEEDVSNLTYSLF